MSSDMGLPQSAYAPERPTVHDRKPVRGSLVWWLRWLGVAAFIVVLLRLPRSGDVQLSQIDLRWLGLCMLLTMGQLLLEAFVWQWLLTMQHIRHAYPKTLLAYLASQYLGLVTPGHVGEFLAAGYISSETGITIGYALSSVVMKKALTWVTVVSLGAWSAVVLLPQVRFVQGVQWVVGASVLVAVALSAGIGLWVVSLRRLARKWQKLSPWQVDMTEFWSGLRTLARPQLIVPLGLTVLAFSLLFVQNDAVLRSLGVALPLALVAKIVAFSRIVARVIPVSVVGFGSKDAAVIELLHQQGIDYAVGLMASLVFLVCSYLVTLLLSGLCWWIKPLVVRRAAPASS